MKKPPINKIEAKLIDQPKNPESVCPLKAKDRQQKLGLAELLAKMPDLGTYADFARVD